MSEEVQKLRLFVCGVVVQVKGKFGIDGPVDRREDAIETTIKGGILV